jgi:hypothetical protein
MCEIDTGDGEPIYGYSATTRKARKHHSCTVCGGPISPGESYTYRSGICDSEPWSEKSCALCLVDDKEFSKAHDVGGVGSMLPDYLDDCIQERGPGWEKWRAMRERLRARRSAARTEPRGGV